MITSHKAAVRVLFLTLAMFSLVLYPNPAKASHTHTTADYFHGVCCPADDGYTHVFIHDNTGAFEFVSLFVLATWSGPKGACNRGIFGGYGYTDHFHTPGNTTSEENGIIYPVPPDQERKVFADFSFPGTTQHRHFHHNFNGNESAPNCSDESYWQGGG